MDGQDAQDAGARPSGELIRRGAAASTSVWAGVHESHQRRLLALARHRLGVRAQRGLSAEDLVQLAWQDLLKVLDTFEDRGPGSLYAFMARRITLRARDQGARAEVKRRVAEELPDPTAGGNSPTVEARVKEAAEKLGEQLLDSRLPRRYAEILVAHYLEGSGVEELAAQQEVTIALIHQLLSRARRRFQELFEAGFPES